MTAASCDPFAECLSDPPWDRAGTRIPTGPAAWHGFGTMEGNPNGAVTMEATEITTRTEVTITTLDSGFEDFGVTDKMGRSVGLVFAVKQVEYRNVPLEAGRNPRYAPQHQEGVWFKVLAQVARNGKRYGAAQGQPEFATIEEAQAEVARRIATARKANVRKFGGK